MQLQIMIVDAFTDTVFKGNSAGVILLEHCLPDSLMQSIAMQNNLSETAFIVVSGDSKGDVDNEDDGNSNRDDDRNCDAHYHIRWFSPLCEIDFCGHATLASAFVIFKQNPKLSRIQFFAEAIGSFEVLKLDSGKIQMDFPSHKPELVQDVPNALTQGLSIAPLEVYRNSQAYFVIYESIAEVLGVQRDNALLKQLAPLDVVVTCQVPSKQSLSANECGNLDQYDFISRYFWPANGGDEDPVTGSAHTGLAPLWAKRLGKNELLAYQASSRGGELECQVLGDRVLVSGSAAEYLTGTIQV